MYMKNSKFESFLCFLIVARFRKYKPEHMISTTLDVVRRASASTNKHSTPSCLMDRQGSLLQKHLLHTFNGPHV